MRDRIREVGALLAFLGILQILAAGLSVVGTGSIGSVGPNLIVAVAMFGGAFVVGRHPRATIGGIAFLWTALQVAAFFGARGGVNLSLLRVVTVVIFVRGFFAAFKAERIRHELGQASAAAIDLGAR